MVITEQIVMTEIAVACEKMFEKGQLPSEAAMNPSEYFMIVGIKIHATENLTGVVVKVKKEVEVKRAAIELDRVLHEVSIVLDLAIVGYSLV